MSGDLKGGKTFEEKHPTVVLQLERQELDDFALDKDLLQEIATNILFPIRNYKAQPQGKGGVLLYGKMFFLYFCFNRKFGLKFNRQKILLLFNLKKKIKLLSYYFLLGVPGTGMINLWKFLIPGRRLVTSHYSHVRKLGIRTGYSIMVCDTLEA